MGRKSFFLVSFVLAKKFFVAAKDESINAVNLIIVLKLLKVT